MSVEKRKVKLTHMGAKRSSLCMNRNMPEAKVRIYFHVKITSKLSVGHTSTQALALKTTEKAKRLD